METLTLSTKSKLLLKKYHTLSAPYGAESFFIPFSVAVIANAVSF